VLLRKSSHGGTEGVSTVQLELEKGEREDLERYLDVTRGEILFAKGVLLVEGDAELFVIPALAKLNNFDFDELGITVCSAAGTNFAPYVKLLGPKALDIPFAVITDFDPRPGGKNLGEGRVLKLLAELATPAELAGKNAQARLVLAAKKGLFLNGYTFEVDLFKCGRHKSMAKTLTELAEFEPAKERAQQWRDDPAQLDPEALLRDIDAIGKGRFGQRLAGNLRNNECPPYIKGAIEYVAAKCH
jgi:putative ATP-dependent endonuclease of OLD family